jgi:GNAT superfamily N-acetyltransferase
VDLPAPIDELLPDGTRVIFRPIRPDDKQDLANAFARLSPESRYHRFFAAVTELSAKDLRYLTEIDYQNHFAWIAMAPDEPGHPGIGVGRWVRLADEPEIAEAAVTVIDDFHHRGVGRRLLELAAETAQDRGIKSFRAWVQGDNRVMLEMLGEMGAHPAGWESGVVQIDVPLIAPTGREPTADILRAVGKGEIAAHAEPDTTAGARLIEDGDRPDE